LSGSIQIGCCVGTIEQDSGAGLLDGDINAARESIVHAVESNQHATGVNDSHVLGNDSVGFLHGSSNEAVSFVDRDDMSLSCNVSWGPTIYRCMNTYLCRSASNAVGGSLVTSSTSAER
jgi:hypothetical protein